LEHCQVQNITELVRGDACSGRHEDEYCNQQRRSFIFALPSPVDCRVLDTAHRSFGGAERIQRASPIAHAMVTTRSMNFVVWKAWITALAS
jgi:hypothetical protein